VGAAQVTPLLWRRRRPWIMLAAVLAIAWWWPVAVALQVVSPGHAWLTTTGLSATIAAGYAVGAFGGRVSVTWPCIIAVTGNWAVLFTTLMLLVGEFDPAAGDPAPVRMAGWVLTFVLIVGALSTPVALIWVSGVVVGERRARLRAREDDAVAQATARAVESARAERIRVAEGLREAVLHRTDQVATAADDGDLDGVLESARGALDAMRGLLSGLRDAPTDARDPQPTVGALGPLCDTARAAGRQVTLHVTGATRVLPADVDVSAYRVVELLLAAGTGPVAVRVEYTRDRLRLAVTGAPPDPDGALAAGLRARVVAVGGSISGSDGTIDIRLPAPAPVQEVTSSPSA
jgi:hypothetical protein